MDDKMIKHYHALRDFVAAMREYHLRNTKELRWKMEDAEMRLLRLEQEMWDDRHSQSRAERSVR